MSDDRNWLKIDCFGDAKDLAGVTMKKYPKKKVTASSEIFSANFYHILLPIRRPLNGLFCIYMRMYEIEADEDEKERERFRLQRAMYSPMLLLLLDGPSTYNCTVRFSEKWWTRRKRRNTKKRRLQTKGPTRRRRLWQSATENLQEQKPPGERETERVPLSMGNDLIVRLSFRD